MARLTKSSKDNLETIITLLWEVAEDLHTRKPLFARICRSLAEQLRKTLDNHFQSFAFDIPRQVDTWHRALLPDGRIAHEPLSTYRIGTDSNPLGTIIIPLDD